MSIGFPSVDMYRSFKGSHLLKNFLSNVFKQVDVNRFMKIYDSAVMNHENSEAIYKELLQRASEAKGGPLSQALVGLNALKGERNTLAENVQKVMDPKQPKDGYCETGMPGRMIKSIAPMVGLKGRVTVVNENESLIQSGFPRPYDAYHVLTYDPLPLKVDSVDIISSFPGLHHCPVNKLDEYIQSIYNALRDGGVFLLREHNALDNTMTDLAHVVHSVFNAASGVSVNEERSEVRNFKSVEEWIKILESKGFCYVSEKPLIREGDSSDNALLKFVKVTDAKAQVQAIRERMISHKNNYTRDLEQTHLTEVEWYNVESSQNLSTVENFWDYPYFRDVKELLTTYGKSWNTARRVQCFTKVATSEFTLMNTTILTMMMTEYIAKGILYTPLWMAAQGDRLLWSKKVDTNWEGPSKFYQEWLKMYGKTLEVTPYYAQSYIPVIGQLWQKMNESWIESRKSRGLFDMLFDRQTIKNGVTGLVMTTDLIGRAMISAPINWFYGGEENADDRKIGMIVKGNHGLSDREEVSVFTLQDFPYAGLIVPRYKGLEKILKEFSENGVEVIEIAGQKQIQVDIISDKNETSYNYERLYDRAHLADDSKKIVSLMVDVADLPKCFKEYTILRVCDY